MTNDSLMPRDDSATARQQVRVLPGQPVVLSISNSSGDISITTSSRTDVAIVTERTDSKHGDDEATMELEVDGNRISVHPNWQIANALGDLGRKVRNQLKEGFNPDEWDFKKMKFSTNASFDIQVDLPRELPDGSSVTVRTAGGDVRAADISARVSVTTANGDVRLDRIDGRVSAHTASGDVSLANVTGSIEANTANGDIHVEGGEAWAALRAVNGDIRMEGPTLKNARVTTVSGDVHADVTLNNRTSYTFDTVSGDITLNTTLPPTGASLNFRAVSGDTKIGGAWTPATGKRAWQLAAGNEGPEIRVKAVSGDLRATATTDPTVSMVNEAAPQDTDKEKEQEAGEDVQAHGGAEAAGGTQVAADFDWEKAKGWVTSVTQKIAQVVNDMDEAGERRRSKERPTATADTDLIGTPPVPPVPPVPPAPPFRRETSDDATSPITNHGSESVTEPLTKPTGSDETEPITMSRPDAPKEDAPETTGQRRLRLLEAVQRGEMTVDEALAQIDGDDPRSSGQ